MHCAPKLSSETPGVYLKASLMFCAPWSAIWSLVTTEIDCGVSRIGVSVLVAVALLPAT